ncbi:MULTISPECIES: hypothetical protein [Paraburkholderia]|uniref:hypothetical protein n=1 Tax=Paraburkholderia TaxID=1822464 RepID=UPI001CC372F4|nr:MULTISPECIES: hypothetical protein [Paraburkholderia]
MIELHGGVLAFVKRGANSQPQREILKTGALSGFGADLIIGVAFEGFSNAV